MNKIAVFDLDGTLLDTLDDLRDSVNHALLAGGMPPRSREEVRSFVGNGIAKLIERSLPQGVSPETVAETLSLFKAHYAENCCNGTRPYDGMPELLRELKAQGFTLAVVSNKADSLSKKLMERFYPGIFTEVRGELPEVRKKPAPDPLLLCCQDINVALSTMIKKAGLPRKYYDQINIDGFIQQARDFNENYTGTLNVIVKNLTIRSAEFPWLVDRAAKLLDWYEHGNYNQIVNSKKYSIV